MSLADGEVPGLVVLVGAARTGTTLLRLALDGHPEIGCPAEAGIPSMTAALAAVWKTIEGLPPDDHQACLPEAAERHIREAVRAPMVRYCSLRGKRLYCDKSLDSVHHLPAVASFFPETRYVLLFRHVLDTVVSGLEASPWGFRAFGYAPFVARSPDNFVAALVNYWLSHVEAALEWEKRHPQACFRVRYEDFVAQPEAAFAGVCRFLGVEEDAGALAGISARSGRARGPGDYKLPHTSAIHQASVGRGTRVPLELIPPRSLELANRTLRELGYEPLDHSWNMQPRGVCAADANARSSLEAILGAASVRSPTGRSAVASIAIVADDDNCSPWIIDLDGGTIERRDGDVDMAILGATDDLVKLFSAEVNPGVLLQSGRIRPVTPEPLPESGIARSLGLLLDAVDVQTGP